MSSILKQDKADILEILTFAAKVMGKPTSIDLPFVHYDLKEEVEKLDPIKAHMITERARLVLNK